LRTEKLKTTVFPQFLRQCQAIRREIIVISGLSEHRLTEAATELDADYEVWCMDYQGPDLADVFMGFNQMLRDWSYPWPDESESGLNGLSPAQYYFAFAFSGIEIALGIVTGSLTFDAEISTNDSMDQAATSAFCATKALAHAKHLLASNLK
jgi:hypothetical protein